MIFTEMTKTGPVRDRKEGLRADYTRVTKTKNPDSYQKQPKTAKFWHKLANFFK